MPFCLDTAKTIIKMKSKTLSAIAFLTAVMGMSATPSNVPGQTFQNEKHNDAIQKTNQVNEREELIKLHPSGGNSYLERSGLSPKEYGLMLQRKGLQKWIKSSKRKRH